MKNYSRILIVRTDRIGDVILTTPAITALRKAYPRAHITILVNPATRDLVQGNPNLDEVLVDDRKGCHKGLWGFLSLIRLVRKNKFEVVFNFHTKKRTNLLCFLSGIPQRVGYKNWHQNKMFGFLLNVQVADDRRWGIKSEAQYCLDILKPIGVYNDNLELFVPLQNTAEEWADDYFQKSQIALGKKIIAVHPGASCPTKKWPGHRFSELINKLIQRYACQVILIGGQETIAISKEICAFSPSGILDMTGKTSLAQLASLLKRCHLLVSNDSGPVHLAAALGTPVVSIFTRNQPGINPERWRPVGLRSRFVAPRNQEPMDFAKGEVKDPEFLEQIQTKEVLEAIDSLFKLC
jgi:heptosyltransferase II